MTNICDKERMKPVHQYNYTQIDKIFKTIQILQ